MNTGRCSLQLKPTAELDTVFTNSVRVLAKPAYVAAHTDPVNALLYTHVTNLGVEVLEWTPWRMLSLRYDVLHVHWPDNILRHKSASRCWLLMRLLFLALDFIRLFGRTVVWTMHNIQSHEKLHPSLEARFWSGLTQRVDGFICPSKRLWNRARATLPHLKNKRNRIIPQGAFTAAYPHPPLQNQARALLQLPGDSEVILFIGRIRPYKNVDKLIRAFMHLGGAHRRLVVAGAPSSDDVQHVIEHLARGDKRVSLDLRFVPDDQVPVYLSACDLVALPFAEISNSGSALMALSFDRPILAPNREALLDLQKSFGSSWVQLYSEPELSPEHLESALASAVGTPRHPFEWGNRTWPVIAEATKAFYEEVLAEHAYLEGRNAP